jgi:hypothetical protein
MCMEIILLLKIMCLDEIGGNLSLELLEGGETLLGT